MVFDPKTLTWKCHVCGEERPDAQISVLTKTNRVGLITLEQNIRYCNDRQKCIDGAKDFSFFKEESIGDGTTD